jgi:diguanylate cyclase (GGDEF)-like protein
LKKLPRLAALAILCLVYFGAGKLGLTMAYVHPSATAVWPCTGIALAAFLILGYEVWPAILLGAFLVNITTAGSPLVCLGIATGNTLESLLGAYLVNRFAGGRNAMQSTPDVFKFALYGGMFSTMISATMGAVSLTLGGYAHWSDFVPIWSTWWLGDAAGAVVVGPVLLLWTADYRIKWKEIQLVELTALLISLVLTSLFVFAGFPLTGTRGYPLEYLCVPFLMWAAFRFGPREAATVTLPLCAVAAWGTVHGFGPFAIGTRNESLLLLQSFVGVIAVMTMALAAVLADRRRAEDRAQYLAISDPLTGLGNYRRVVDALEAEIKRSDRTRRSFAFLLMDLDGLKTINDTYGHLTGNRALCRLAKILQTHSRAIDTPARFGGDEFALVIPEANHEAAQQIALRISSWLAGDGEQPQLSVSIGMAVWPENGETVDMLLGAADRMLYEVKRQPKNSALQKLEQRN